MITHNKRKFEESKSFLPTLRRIDKDLKELQSSNPKEVVREKMKEALKVIDGHIVVETVALCCEGLKGLPGPFDLFKIKKFDVKDLANMVIKSGNTRAKAISCICFANSPSEMYFFEGSCDGTIVQPRGETEFDWDKIFQPKGFKKTYAEMTIKEKNQISMRKIAFDKLLNFLHKKYSFAI
jgi:inosine triphosphate pyrophosphatase